jgi:predicted flap endonuclease-1-like 5' DNA nuclease
MGLFPFIAGAIIGFLVAWFYFSQQCRAQLANRDNEIARLRQDLADAKLEPEEDKTPPPSVAAARSEAKPEDAARNAVQPLEPETAEPAAQSPLLAAPGLNVEPDDLTRIKGIGHVLQTKLNELGIVTYRQIAEFSEADIARVNESLDFPGRIERERWVEQAEVLIEKNNPSQH